MSECVKVIVRCRPMNQREKDLSCKCCLTMQEDRAHCSITNMVDPKAPPKAFTFDGTYFVNSTTENIYNDIAYPLVEGVTEGYNGTIFAYGQTGCGKSFTMQGINDPPTQRGIIPRAFDHIFETVSCEDNTKFLIHASYCEIYNEEIRDLLGKDVKAKLELHEHPEKGVYVNGLSQHPVHNVVECNKIMERGWKNRATGATLMNADSSRSHSIFTINLEMMTPDDSGEEHIRAGKLNLVDLAGSERQSKTGATGDRLKEATKINLSLSALGNVISALVDGKSKHIPYRDSKLTRLLQDSLGGNTKTLMVACLSPADNNYDETLSTLRYANRAKNIKNKPKINEDPKDALLRQYQEEIQKLKAMLMGQIPLPQGGFDDVVGGNYSAPAQAAPSSDESLRDELEREKEKIKEEYDRKLEEMQRQYEEEKVTKVKLEQDMNKLRKFYDEKLSSVQGQIERIPTTAEAGDVSEESKEDKKGKRKAMVAGGVVGGAAVGTAAAAGGTTVVKEKVIVKNADGTPAKDADGKVITKVVTRTVTKTEYIETDRQGDDIERPESVMGENLPEGPNVDEMRLSSVSDIGDDLHQSGPTSSRQSHIKAPTAMVPTQSQSQQAVAHPDQDKKVSIVSGQMVIQSTQPSGDESIIIRPTAEVRKQSKQDVKDPNFVMKSEGEGMVAPRSSPTNGSTEQIKFQQQEALKRLEEIQMQMVGGENAENKELKEKRKKRKTFAEERKRKLAEAIAKMDDDGIMLQIYDNIGDELKAKNTILQKEKDKNESLNREILDLQSEFEFEKIDYLETIRQQDRNLKLLQEIIDRIQPGIRRDCNYYNIDKIKMQSKWDENEERWIMPKLVIERTSLPGDVTTFPKATGRGKMSNGHVPDDFQDNFRPKIMQSQDNTGEYFRTKRQNQLVQEPLERVDMGEVKKSYNITSTPVLNGVSRGSLHGDEQISKTLQAAQVHGQLYNTEEGMSRTPGKLEPLTFSKKAKKKKTGNMSGY